MIHNKNVLYTDKHQIERFTEYDLITIGGRNKFLIVKALVSSSTSINHYKLAIL